MLPDEIDNYIVDKNKNILLQNHFMGLRFVVSSLFVLRVGAIDAAYQIDMYLGTCTLGHCADVY